MKKLIYAGFAVLLAFALITCEGITPPNGDDDLTDWEYSNGKFTIYLEGGVPAKTASRALSSDLTRMGHDFYEVVFYDGTNVARASWDIGESVGVKNVPRGTVGTGITYDLTGASVDPGTDDTLAVPASNKGYAALFVGRNNTLLAVGRLVAVNGATSTTIDEKTTSVTFEVAAFEAGTSSTVADSSFLTASGGTGGFAVANINTGNTLVADRAIDGKNYPLFSLPYTTPHQATVAARYTVGFVTAATATQFWPAVRLGALTAKIEIRQPRVPSGGINYYVKNAFLTKATLGTAATDNIKVEMTNNKTGTAYSTSFTNGIEFLFTTGATANKGIFSFNFEVPVVAITNALPSPNPLGIPAANTWYVRPAYGAGMYDLDDGKKGTGGCILIGFRANELDTIGVSSSTAD